MTFENVFVLALIPVVLIAIATFAIYFRRKNAKITKMFAVNADGLNLIKHNFGISRYVRNALWTLGIVFLLIAIARPQWGHSLENKKQEGLSVLFALDTSKSMLADDVRPNRLDLAKLSIFELLHSLSGNRVGLIAFAGASFLQCPITSDFGAFKLSLKALDTSIIPIGGTNIASAINLAEKTFDNNNSYKRLILITDGENLDGDAISAAEVAAKAGIVIYTVGIGTTNGTAVSVKNNDGQSTYLKDGAGNKVVSRLDEEMLQKIASKTSGFYVPIGNAGEGLREIYEMTLKHLPKEKFETVEKKPIERFNVFAALAAVLLILDAVLRCKFPKKRNARMAKISKPFFKFKKAKTAISILIIYSATNSTFGDFLMNSGQKFYESGNLPAAEEYYLKKLNSIKNDWRLHFNLGNVLYRQDKFDESVKNFEKALNLCNAAAKQSGIFYNIGNAKYKNAEKLPESTAEEIKAKIGAMEPCLSDYKSAAALDDSASDILHNMRFVEKRLEELRKKLENEQNKSDNKDNKKDESNKNEDNKQSDGQKNADKDDSNDKNNSENQQNNQDAKNDNKDSQGQQNNAEQQSANQTENKKFEMESLLKSSSADEKILPIMPHGNKSINNNSPLKDW